MSHTSPRLNLPLLAPSQAQKHVTHNEALARLDLLVQLSVQAFDAVTPPTDPVEGDVFALGAVPTGSWAGEAGQLAGFSNGGWLFIAPQTGWQATLAGTVETRIWTGTSWEAAAFDQLGVNASADATNRLAVAADATLLTHDGAGHQVKVNKAGASDTASLLFQTSWSGRAEMGTAGSDDFAVKVSADGASWVTALRADVATGAVTVPALRSGTVSIGNDAVATLVPPVAGGFVFLMIDDPAFPQTHHSGIFAFDTGSSPALQAMALGSNMDNAGTSVLTGTTGPASTTSVAATSGGLLIENRFGSSRTVSYTFIGGA
ncbi:MAG: DUF2793 domain-containing protein [Pseudomonadota bacterium]